MGLKADFTAGTGTLPLSEKPKKSLPLHLGSGTVLKLVLA
jgi:hypothetical protein